jgi:large-conductance mechanosensitive channel
MENRNVSISAPEGLATVVKSLVDDVIMPPIGALTSGVNFKDKAWEIPAMANIPPVTRPIRELRVP